MAAAEAVIRAGLLKLGGSMLEQLLAAGNGYRGPRVPCGQGHEAVFAGYRDKSFDTVLGPVALTRAWSHCAECERGLAPRDAEHGVVGTSMSPGLAAMNDIAAAAGPFAGAARLLEEPAGVRLPLCARRSPRSRRPGCRSSSRKSKMPSPRLATRTVSSPSATSTSAGVPPSPSSGGPRSPPGSTPLNEPSPTLTPLSGTRQSGKPPRSSRRPTARSRVADWHWEPVTDDLLAGCHPYVPSSRYRA